MSGWTSAGPNSEDAANGAGRPGRTEAATDGAATTGTGGATEDEAEPAAAAVDAPAPPRAGGPPDKEEPEAMGRPTAQHRLAPRSTLRDPSTAPVTP